MGGIGDRVGAELLRDAVREMPDAEHKASRAGQQQHRPRQAVRCRFEMDHEREEGDDGEAAQDDQPLVREGQGEMGVAQDVEGLEQVGEDDGFAQHAALVQVGARPAGTGGEGDDAGQQGPAGKRQRQREQAHRQEQVRR